ncbi:MAG: hypothetical protein R2704_18790 [Microthrixaceae bacterium]
MGHGADRRADGVRRRGGLGGPGRRPCGAARLLAGTGATVGGTIEAYDVWFDQSIVELYSMGLSTEEGTELPGSGANPPPT